MVIDIKQLTKEELLEFFRTQQKRVKEMWAVLSEWCTGHYTKSIKAIQKLRRDIKQIDYVVMEQHNPLTNEVLYYIEIKKYGRPKYIYRIKNVVHQQLFGCDRDGFFGNYQNALKIQKFISGETKIINRPAVKPTENDERR